MKIIPLLEREGGHIATLASLFIFCIVLHLYFPDSTIIADSAKGFAGALLYSMKGVGNSPVKESLTTDTAAILKTEQK